MSEIFFITNDRAKLTARGRAVQDVLTRLASVREGTPQTAAPQTETPAAGADDAETARFVSAINRLHDEGRLVFKEVSDSESEVVYVASREVKERVFSASADAHWPEKILKRHRNAFRVSVGTLFRFPLEDGGGYLQPFITDWSPFPAAAALAVHKDHPSVRKIEKRPGSYFTGFFVRNPLTGDLMPVWVATWVKPEFGTGVVAVNPAHDRVDLNFAREVGLPVRFGLVKAPVTSDASTWPEPPVIKEGTAAKTGNWDGLGHQEALATYFEVLSEQGYAERHVDRAVGGCRIASFTRGARGNVLQCSRCGLLQESDADGPQARGHCPACEGACEPGTLAGADVLRATLAMESADAPELLCLSAEIETTLLCARLLFEELFARPLAPRSIHLIQETEKTNKEAPPEVAVLAALVAAPLDQIAVLKQAVFDQTQLFRKRHQEFLLLYGDAAPAAQTPEASTEKALVRAKEALLRWNPAEAFSTLYKWQKDLGGKPADVVAGVLPAYFSLAYVLSGYDYPQGLALGDGWRGIEPAGE